jgi:non-specific serine/threonine protein kinase
MSALKSKNLLEIRLFGPLSVRVDDTPLPSLRTKKGHWLLALLALRHDREVERNWLAATLWPDSDESQGLYNLRRSLSDLRQAMGNAAGLIESPAFQTLRLSTRQATLDIALFEAALRSSDPAEIEQAVALYQGTLLEGCTEEWVVSERLVWEQNYLDALEKRAALALQSADDLAAGSYLKRVLAADPLRESALRLLLQTLARQGEFAAALQTYRDFRLRLTRELHTQPSPETAAIYQEVREEARKRAKQRAVPPAESTPSPAPSRSHSTFATPLIGREEELAQIETILSASRLLTLTGTGGIGKTRLARQIALDTGSDFEGGCSFIDLSALHTPDLLLQTIAAALEIGEQPGRSLIEIVQERLTDAPALLILDNCEHLLGECTRLIAELRTQCRAVRFLITSRQPLGISGEVVLRIPPLSLPASAGIETPDPLLEESAALQLFVVCAMRSLPSFRLTPHNSAAVAQLCQSLDGVPLAIELTAAWVRSLTGEQIAERLNQSFRLLTRGGPERAPRHRSLQAAMDWGYLLLPEAERVLLRRLSIFAGGFTLEAAEAICSEPESETESPVLAREQIMEHLLALQEKSLVQFDATEDNPRYRLLETVLHYARERREEANETSLLQERHAAFFVQMATEAAPKIHSKEQTLWLHRVRREMDNFRAVFAWGRSGGDAMLSLQLANKLLNFWVVTCQFSEGRNALESLLSLPETAPPTERRAWAMNAAGVLAKWQTEYVTARQHMEGALTIHRELGNRRGEASCLGNIGYVAQLQGNIAEARALHETSLAIFRDLDLKWDIGAEMSCLGSLAEYIGDLETAQAWYSEGLALVQELGDKWCIAHNLHDLSVVRRKQNDLVAAQRLCMQGLAIRQEIGDTTGLARSHYELAQLARWQNDYERAQEHLTASRTVLQEQPDNLTLAALELEEGLLALARGDAARSGLSLREGLRLMRMVGWRPGIASALESMVHLYAAQGEYTAAARLFGAAEALREEVGSPLTPGESARHAPCLQQLRMVLGKDYTVEYTRGRALPQEEALLLAQLDPALTAEKGG